MIQEGKVPTEIIDQKVLYEVGEKKDSQHSLKLKEMEAHASLAKCYLKMKRIEDA